MGLAGEVIRILDERLPQNLSYEPEENIPHHNFHKELHKLVKHIGWKKTKQILRSAELRYKEDK